MTMSFGEQPFDLSKRLAGLERTGRIQLLSRAGGPPPRIDGHTVTAAVMTQNDPHAGERHPDGDELLYLISGRLQVMLDDDEENRLVQLQPGDAFVVPQGVWHQVLLQEPSHLLAITPGPSIEYRPLQSDDTI